MKRAFLLLLIAAAWLHGQRIECNVPVTGTLQPTGTGGTQGTTAVYTTDGLAGEVVLIRMVYLTRDSNFRPGLRVHGPSGNIAPTGTAAGSGVDVAGEFAFVSSGDHTIEVTTFGNVPGSFRLLMLRLNRPCGATLSCGNSASGQVSGVLNMRTYTFPAAANDVLSFRFVKTGPFAPPGTPSGVNQPADTNVAMALYGPDGKLLQTADGLPAAVQQSGRNRMNVDVRTPLSGPVTAVIFDQLNNTASYSVSASRLNGACGDKPLTCGSVADGQISGVVQVDGYTITAEAGDTYLVKLARADTSPAARFLPFGEIYDTQGKLITTVGAFTVSPHALALGAFTAPAAGRYTILAEDGADGTRLGAYSISASRVNRPCNAQQALGCGTVLDGKVEGLLRQNTYALTAAANDSFLIRLLRSGPNGNFRPKVDIYDPQGNIVQTTTTGDVARVNFTVPVSGSYTVIVSDGADGGQSGTYSLSSVRTNGPCGAGAMECGKVLSSSLAGPLRYSTYAYNAAAGESFTIRLLNGTGNLQPDLEIYDPAGQRVGLAVPGNVRGYDVVNPSTGQYTVIALDTSPSPGQGSFAVQLQRTKNACGVSPPRGQSAAGIVSGASPFVAYTIPVNTDELVNIRSASFTPGFAALMELYDSSGARVDSGTYSLVRRASASGEYTAIVSGSSPGSTGRFSLSWQVLNNATNTTRLACGSTAASSLSPSNAYRYYTAGLNNADIAKLLLTRSSSNFSPQVELYDPSGARIAVAPNEIQQRVRGDGDYLVVVAPPTAAGESGTYSLALQRPNNPCSAANLSCGQSLLRSADTPGQMDAVTFSGKSGDATIVRQPVRGGTYAPFVELFDSSGNLLRGSSTGTLNITLPATGTYTLLIRDRNGTGTGSYRVALQTDPACPVNDKEAPTVRLLQPTGGEVIAGGTTYRIVWQSDDNVDVTSQEIRLSSDGGKTFPTTIAGGVSGSAGLFDWAVPASVAPTRTAVIRVTAADAAGNQQFAQSDSLTVIGSGFTPNTTVNLSYDVLNRITRAAYSDGRSIAYTYDSSGNLVEITVSGQ